MLLCVPVGSAAQTGTITGRVLDAESGRPVPAAQVFIADMDVGVLTQQNGSYVLLEVPAGTWTVSVQRSGYRGATEGLVVSAGGAAALHFRLRQEALALEETILGGTPLGTSRRALGSTVTTIDVGGVAEDATIGGFQDLLTARTPGLRYTRLSGNLGTGSPMTIRGVGSFSLSRNQPLVYVDGVRVNADVAIGPVLGGGRSVSALDDFGFAEIERVEVLKGPAATTLYGSDASAGVIQIITKRGLEGRPEWSFAIRQGVNYMPNPAGRLGTQWTCPTDDLPGGTNPGCPSSTDLQSYNMYDEATNYIRDGYFAWPTQNLFHDGATQTYTLDVRGGTQAIRYFLAASYDDETGIVVYNADETFRLRANVGVTFNDHFALDVSTGYVDGYTSFMGVTPEDGGLWQDLVWSNGYYLDRVTPFDMNATQYSTRNCSNTSSTCRQNPRLGGFQEHLPSDVAQDTEATRDYARFTGGATLNVTTGELRFGGMTASLRQRLTAGVDRGWDVNRSLFRRETYEPEPELLAYCARRRTGCVPNVWGDVYTETTTGQLTYERPVTSEYSFDYAVTAALQATEAWRFSTSFGAQYHEREVEDFANSGQGFASIFSTTINQIGQSGITTKYDLVENKALGFHVQEEIGFNDRIFLTGALRFDDSSTFGSDVPVQKYPRLSGTWVVSEESFWGFAPVSSLRIRGAWGKAGRQPATASSQGSYVPRPGLGGGTIFWPSSPASVTVEPEISTELELGVDLALFDDRLWGSFAHYWRKDEQALLEAALPASSGIPGLVEQNLGRIDNWGWEAQLGMRVLEGGSYSFDVDVAADYVNNEIRDLGTFPGTASIAIGLPYPNQLTEDYVLSAQLDPAGDVVNAFGERISALCDEGVSLAPDPSAPDAAQFGRIAGGAPIPCATIPNRNLYVGRAFATHTVNVAPRVSLLDHRVQIFLLAEGQYGRWGEAGDKEWGHIHSNSMVSRLEDDLAWVYGDRIGDATKRRLYDASFWKLREIGVRAALPEDVVAALGADRASVSLSARNVWTIWQAQPEIFGLPISDPEYGAATLDGDSNFWETPSIASVDLTLRVTF
jgi:TonB-dependent SusC/RagA subfamily outer membrane receptor